MGDDGGPEKLRVKIYVHLVTRLKRDFLLSIGSLVFANQPTEENKTQYPIIIHC
jgi:hypothetical protein